jgi:hypothetical protein
MRNVIIRHCVALLAPITGVATPVAPGRPHGLCTASGCLKKTFVRSHGRYTLARSHFRVDR